MTAIMPPSAVATANRARLIEELANVAGKAEIIKGKVVRMSAAKYRHGRVWGRIYISLDRHEADHGGGYAVGDNVGFLVELPGRFSFSPDAAWISVPPPEDGDKFVEGAPVFAVEIRSLSQYSPKANTDILEKIKEYFAAGTMVVWDVDFLVEGWIKKYTPETIANPTVFKRGDIADAEPAVPGWHIAVNDVF